METMVPLQIEVLFIFNSEVHTKFDLMNLYFRFLPTCIPKLKTQNIIFHIMLNIYGEARQRGSVSAGGFNTIILKLRESFQPTTRRFRAALTCSAQRPIVS